ncbi:MAG TPA: hypothetical protein PK765_03435 [bacterium]|nr:hypothetical protein [bacterium]
MEDNTAAFEEIRTITENFEAQMRGGIARLLDVEHSIAQKEVSLVSLDDESRREARKEMDNLISMKALIEAKLESVFIETFDQLDPVIDPDSRAQRIWTQVRKMYENAFNARDFSLVYALCGNAQSPEVSDTATPTNPNSDTRSESILSAEERASVIRRISHLSDERLVEIQSRLAVAKSKIVSKPKISEKDHRTLAILTEIERMVRDEMLYSDK